MITETCKYKRGSGYRLQRAQYSDFSHHLIVTHENIIYNGSLVLSVDEGINYSSER